MSHSSSAATTRHGMTTSAPPSTPSATTIGVVTMTPERVAEVAADREERHAARASRAACVRGELRALGVVRGRAEA